MLEAALRDVPWEFGSDARELFREPELPTGCPDVVVVYSSRSTMKSAGRPALSEETLRLLHHIHRNPGVSVVDVTSDLCLSMSRLGKTIDALLAREFIHIDGGGLWPEPRPHVFPVRSIIAIEAKMRDWRRALDQATANTWFASESFVLLPRRNCFDGIAAEAEQRGVGVLSYDGAGVEVVLPARVLPIPSSYGSWLFNEWFATQH